MKNMNQDVDLEAIEARLSLATAGPWISMVEGRDHSSGSSFIRTADPENPGIELTGGTIADQEFIAACRQDVPALIALVKSLRKERG